MLSVDGTRCKRTLTQSQAIVFEQHGRDVPTTDVHTLSCYSKDKRRC